MHLLVSNLIDSNFPGKWLRPTASKPDAWLCAFERHLGQISRIARSQSRLWPNCFPIQTKHFAKQWSTQWASQKWKLLQELQWNRARTGKQCLLFRNVWNSEIIATPEVICDVQSHHQPHHIHHGHHQLLSWIHVCSSCSCWAGVGLRVRYLGWLGEAWNCWMSLITVIQHKHLTLSLRVLWNFQSETPTSSQKRGRNSKTAAFNAAWVACALFGVSCGELHHWQAGRSWERGDWPYDRYGWRSLLVIEPVSQTSHFQHADWLSMSLVVHYGSWADDMKVIGCY